MGALLWAGNASVPGTVRLDTGQMAAPQGMNIEIASIAKPAAALASGGSKRNPGFRVTGCGTGAKCGWEHFPHEADVGGGLQDPNA